MKLVVVIWGTDFVTQIVDVVVDLSTSTVDWKASNKKKRYFRVKYLYKTYFQIQIIIIHLAIKSRGLELNSPVYRFLIGICIWDFDSGFRCVSIDCFFIPSDFSVKKKNPVGSSFFIIFFQQKKTCLVKPYLLQRSLLLSGKIEINGKWESCW